MAVSRVRCASCREYVSPEGAISVGISRVCSEGCLTDLSRRRPKPKRDPRAGRSQGPGRLDAGVRAEIRKRDGERCRWCGRNGSSGLQIHHILYRSQGGPDHHSNLILLCQDHHQQVHGNKRHWQPVLLATIWLGYVAGRMLTVPEVERRLVADGMLDSL